MKQKAIKDVRLDEYFKRSKDAKKVYVRGAYDRSEKDYSCYEFEDINKEIFLRGTKKFGLVLRFKFSAMEVAT